MRVKLDACKRWSHVHFAITHKHAMRIVTYEMMIAQPVDQDVLPVGKMRAIITFPEKRDLVFLHKSNYRQLTSSAAEGDVRG